MQSGKPRCENRGFNQWNANPTDKLGTYCYGPIPNGVTTFVKMYLS